MNALTPSQQQSLVLELEPTARTMAGDGVGTTSFGLAVGGVGPLRTKRVGAGVVGRLGPGIRLSGLGVDTLDDSPAVNIHENHKVTKVGPKSM